MYLWLKFLHVLGAFLFFLAHGASAFVYMKMRQERNPERLKALLDLRAYAEPWMSWTGLLFISGIVLGFLGHWWKYVWIWLSLVLLILVSLPMTFWGRMYFERVRKAIGMDNRLKGSKPGQTEKPVSAQELEKIIEAGKPGLVAAMGVLGLVVIVWLMMFKPF